MVVSFWVVVISMNVDRSLSDSAVNGVVFMHFPGVKGVLPLVARDSDRPCKGTTLPIRVGVLCDVFYEVTFLRYTPIKNFNETY